MSIFRSIILGITQGLTEFMPVSSSGHLLLVRWLFGWDDFAETEALSETFDVALHLGTLVGLVAYFRRDLARIGRAAVSQPRSTDGRLGWLFIVATIPAAVVGVVLTGPIDRNTGRIWLVAVMLILGALALAWADGTLGRRSLGEVRLRDALIVGAGQTLALQPGVSRAGITISIGRFVGLDRDGAVRFAFLLSVPVTVGALILRAVDAGRTGGIPSDFVAPFAWGVATAAVTGYIAVWGTLRLVRTRSFLPFVLYRLILGVAVLILLATPFR